MVKRSRIRPMSCGSTQLASKGLQFNINGTGCTSMISSFVTKWPQTAQFLGSAALIFGRMKSLNVIGLIWEISCYCRKEIANTKVTIPVILPQKRGQPSTQSAGSSIKGHVHLGLTVTIHMCVVNSTRMDTP